MTRMDLLRPIARLGLVAVATAAWIGVAQAAPVVLDLTGRADALNGGVGQVGQFGDYGLFLGQDFNFAGSETGPINNGSTRYYNWRWNSVEMTIFDDGNANISGAITRLLDENSGGPFPNGADRIWNLSIDLAGLVLTGGAWRGGNTSYFEGIIQALQGTGEDGVGLEWTTVDMSIAPSPNYPGGTDVPPDDWEGFAMPGAPNFHPRAAELHFDQGTGLTFEAWYKHNPLNTSKYYKVGDTKAVAALRSSPPPTGVPEPGTLAVLGTGLLGLWLVRRRRSPAA